MSSPPDSVTRWLQQLQQGDPAAAQQLWQGYFHRLVALARQRLRGARLREADEEDVALSAFDSFCRGAVRGRFPLLGDRGNLWRLLVTLTVRKAADLANRQRRKKYGGGAVRGDSALVGPPDADGPAGADQFAGGEPTPEFAAEVAEECRRLLDLLGDEELRSVALWKMEGYTNAEIATQLGCVESTVERRLRVIRSLWRGEGPA